MNNPPERSQTAAVQGQGNVIVQISGDRNTVQLSAPHLILQSAKARGAGIVPKHDLELLIPYRCPVPVIGRDRMLETLWTWLHNKARVVSVAVLTGRGGSGKTRLSLELLNRLIESNKDWTAGFLTRDHLTAFESQPDRLNWGWRTPTLAIVDYAAPLTTELQSFLNALLNGVAGGIRNPFRLLLLERQASRDAGWLQTLLGWGDSDILLRELFDPWDPLELEPLASLPDRRLIIGSTLQAIAKTFNVSVPSLPKPGENTNFDDQLAHPAWADPLPLMMAALVAARGDEELTTTLSLQRLDLAFRVAEHERKRIRSFATKDAHALTPILLESAAAISCILGGMPLDSATVVLEKCLEGYVYSGGAKHLPHVLQQALPSDNGEDIAPIAPDLVAEAFTLLVLTQLGRKEQERLLLQLRAPLTASPIPFLVRLAQDFSGGEWRGVGYSKNVVKRLRAAPIGWLTAFAQKATASDVPLLMQLVSEMPADTGVLASHALELTDRFVSVIDKAVFAAPDRETKQIQISTRMMLVHRLYDAGKSEAAAETVEKVLPLLIEVTRETTDDSITFFCLGLSQCASYGAAGGRFKTAATAAAETRKTIERLPSSLVENQAAAFAAAYQNLAFLRNSQRRPRSALVYSTRALELYRLARKRGDLTEEQDYINTLTGHCGTLKSLGKYAEAVKHATEAVAIAKPLAPRNPDAYRPHLFAALSELAAANFHFGEITAASAVIGEATSLLDSLVAHPIAHLAEAIVSLHDTRGRVFEQKELYSDAAGAWQETISAMVSAMTLRPTPFDAALPAICARYVAACHRSGVPIDKNLLASANAICKKRWREIMTDPITLAMTFAAFAKPYLIAAAAKKIAEETLDGSLARGKRAWSWLKSKVHDDSARQRLVEIEINPENNEAWKRIIPIVTELARNRVDRQELEVLIQSLSDSEIHEQTSEQRGDGNKSAQISGSDNQVTM